MAIEKKINIVLVVIVIICSIMLTTTCQFILLENIDYGKMLAQSCIPGLKAQVPLDERISFLANAPDGKGVFAILENGTITYYDENLKKGDTYTSVSLDKLPSTPFPAHAMFLASTNTVVLTHFKQLSRLFLFNDSKTYFERQYGSYPYDAIHTVAVEANQSGNNFVFMTTNVFYLRNNSPAPNTIYDGVSISYTLPVNTILIYATNSTAYGLQLMQETYQEDRTKRYDFKLWQNTFYFNTTGWDIGNCVQDPPNYAAVVEEYMVPNCIYVFDTYFAVLFINQYEPYTQYVCYAFSRSDGRILANITLQHTQSESSYAFAFGSNRIYIAKEKKLSAVEVRP